MLRVCDSFVRVTTFIFVWSHNGRTFLAGYIPPLSPRTTAVIGDLMQQLDVFISVKPKKGQMQSVIIKSIEQNLHCVYQARMKLLECSYQPTQAATPSDTIAIATSIDEPPMFQEKKGEHIPER